MIIILVGVEKEEGFVKFVVVVKYIIISTAV